MYPRAGGDYVYLREAFHPARGLPGRLALVLRDLRRDGRDAGGGLRRGARAAGSGSRAPEARRSRSRRSLACSWLNCGGVRYGRARQQRDGLAQDGALARLRGAWRRSAGAATPRTCGRSSRAPSRRRRRRLRASRSRRCSSATSAGTPRSTWRARSAIRAQRAALALPRPRALHARLPAVNVVYLYALPVADAARAPRTPARPRRASLSATAAAGSSRASCCSRSSGR